MSFTRIDSWSDFGQQGRDIQRAYSDGSEGYGVKRNDKDKSLYYDENRQKAKVVQEDGDTFLIQQDDNGNYYAEYLPEEDDDNDSSSSSSRGSSSSSSNSGHYDGTGSTQERVDAFSGALTTRQKNAVKGFMNDDIDEGVSRDDIQEWLEDNNFDDSDIVENGFNSDDVLQYYSYISNGANEIYYHLLANEAWLDKDADGDNNSVNGRLSDTELTNFFNGGDYTRFNKEVDETSDMTSSAFNKWKSSNIAVGNNVHKNYVLSDMTSFMNKYYDENSNSYDDDDDDYNSNDYRYEDKTISSSNLNTTTEVKNVFTQLANLENDFEASINMDEKTSVYDQSTKNYVTLKSGKTYDITKVTSSYVYLDVNGETVKVARGTTGTGFEKAVADKISEMTYSADEKITNSSTSSSSGSYSNSSGGSYNLAFQSSAASKVETYVNTLEDASSFDATMTISKKYWFDEDGKAWIPLGDYEITKVTSSYVWLEDEDGETYKIPRGTNEYEFEWYCSKENKQGSITSIDASYDK